MPALGLRELGPDWHAAADDAVGEDPEERAGSGLLDGIGAQTRALLAALGHFAVAFGAVLIEKGCARCHGVGITFERIAARGGLPGSFRQFGVDVFSVGLVAFFLCEGHWDCQYK